MIPQPLDQAVNEHRILGRMADEHTRMRDSHDPPQKSKPSYNRVSHYVSARSHSPAAALRASARMPIESATAKASKRRRTRATYPASLLIARAFRKASIAAERCCLSSHKAKPHRASALACNASKFWALFASLDSRTGAAALPLLLARLELASFSVRAITKQGKSRLLNRLRPIGRTCAQSRLA